MKPRIKRAWGTPHFLGFAMWGWDCDGEWGATPLHAYYRWKQKQEKFTLFQPPANPQAPGLVSPLGPRFEYYAPPRDAWQPQLSDYLRQYDHRGGAR